MKRVIVLGSNGMLGHMVHRYLLKHGLDVIAFDDRWSSSNHHELSKKLEKLEPDACINAIGVRERSPGGTDHLMWTNGALPGLISQALPADTLFIHASSDAVFASDRNECAWDLPHDPDTEYGHSKSLGELGLKRANDWIIRSSIIGPEVSTQKSLMSWYLHQRQPVKGFTNQIWNGITTLEWARLGLNIINGKIIDCEKVLQPGILPPVSKHALLKMISRVLNHPTDVLPQASDFPVQRSLVPNVDGPSLEEQLIQLASFD